MSRNTNCAKLMKQMLGLAVIVGGGILAKKLITKKIHDSKETYQITVNFDDDENIE